jgi:hypothetical protein
MAMILKQEKKEFKERELIEPDIYNAVCIGIIDIGTHERKFNNQLKNQNRKRLRFELVDSLMKDGRPFVIEKEYTFSLYEKSNLYKDLVSWRGRNFTDEELNGFDLKIILNKPCRLNIIQITNENDGKEYSVINSIIKADKNFIMKKTYNDLFYFDLEEFDIDAFEKLPDFLKNKIKQSPEYQSNNKSIDYKSKQLEDEAIMESKHGDFGDRDQDVDIPF